MNISETQRIPISQMTDNFCSQCDKVPSILSFYLVLSVHHSPSLSLCPSLSLSLSLSITLSLSLSLSITLPLSLSITLSLSMSITLPLSLSITFPLSLSITFPPPFCPSFSLSLCPSLSLSLSVHHFPPSLSVHHSPSLSVHHFLFLSLCPFMPSFCLPLSFTLFLCPLIYSLYPFILYLFLPSHIFIFNFFVHSYPALSTWLSVHSIGYSIFLFSCTVLDNFYVEKPIWMVDLGDKKEVNGAIIVNWQGVGQG